MTVSTLAPSRRRASEISPQDEQILRRIIRAAQPLSPDLRARLASALGAIEGEIPEWVGVA